MKPQDFGELTETILTNTKATSVSNNRITQSLRLLSALGGGRQRETVLFTGTLLALSNDFHKVLRGCFMSGTDFLTFSSPSHLSFNTHLKCHLFQELLIHPIPPSARSSPAYQTHHRCCAGLHPPVPPLIALLTRAPPEPAFLCRPAHT